MGVLLAIVLGTLSVGENFRLYNIVPCLPGEETEAAARAVDLQRRTGVDHALYSLTLHPTGKPAMAKVERYVESFRRFRQALEGTKVRPAVLVQAILGHWPRVDRDIEPWTRTVDSTGSEVRFCPLDPGFAAYITEVFTRLAKEHPAFILTDDDVRAYSHNAECFCDTHVRLFNACRGTSYTADALRAALKAAKPDDPDYVAFLALQREMIERHVIGRARAAIDAVDPSIPGGICVAGEEHFLCAPLARGMAAKGQVPVMRISSGCYNERAGASRVPGNVCRTLGFAEYYRGSGIDLLGEADTCPHNLWSKSALSFFSHLVNAAFAGLKGAKTWYVGGRKPNASRPISPKYTEILERHRGYLDALAADVAGSEPTGLAVPCFTNFPGWHLMTNHDQFFVEPSNAGAEVCVPFGIPFRASKEFGRGVFALYSAAEANRLTDAELERLFSGKVLVFREAALALTARGRGDLLGVDATKEKLVFNAERDALTGDTMGRSPIRGEDVRLTPRGEAEVLTTLGFGELGKYEPVTPSAVLFRNRLGGTAVTVSYSAQLFYLTVFSESRKAWLTAILDRLNGERTAFAAGHDQDVLVWTRTKPDGTVLVMAENVNTEPIDRLSLRLPEGTWRAELLADDGSWQAVQGTRRGEFTDFPVPIAYYATAVLRFTPETGRTAAEAFSRKVNAEIERVSHAGGGRVTVPSGVWRTGKIELRSNVELHLEKGAVLRFTDDPNAYLPAVLTSWEGVECQNYSPLIYAFGATNIAITGEGRIEAEMDTWKRWGGLRKPAAEAAKRKLVLDWGANDVPVRERDLTRLEGSNLRPPFIGLNRCGNVRLEGFSIRNTPFWTIHVLQCEDVVLRGLDVDSNVINNSDGANFECTRNVLVEDCVFTTGDDVICCKSGLDRDGRRRGLPTENVVVRRCLARQGHGFLTIGSECSGGVRNVLMEDCEIRGECGNLLNIKTRETRGGFIENVTVRRVRADRVRMAVVNVLTGGASWSEYQEGLPVVLTRIDGVTAEDIEVKSARWRLNVRGDARRPVRRLSVKNVRVADVREPDVVENVLPEEDGSLRLADLRVRDPFIVNVGGECPYLLYMSDSWLDGTAGVSVSRSRDLVSWTKPQNVMRAPGWCGYVWAPEIHRWKDAWYMFVTLKEKRELHRPIKTMVPGEPDWEHGPGAATNSTCHAVWVYRSENPMGPFRPVSDDAIVDREWVSLDGTLAVEDGKPWMVFTHDWAQVKVGTYELAPMSDDLTRFLAPPRTLFTAAAFDMEKDRGVTDGAFVYRSPKSGKLFMIWSTHNPARPRGRDYCVVLTESASGRLAGPWTNHRLLFDDNGGHGMIFRKTDGELALCLHCPEEWGHEHPRILPLEDTGDTLRIRDANEKTN